MKNLFIALLLTVSHLLPAQQPRVLSLEECIRIAIENNLNVQRSSLNLETAKVNLMQAQARRLPSLNASGGVGLNWGRSINPNTNQFISQRINTNFVGANGNLPLVQGLQISNTIKQSKTDLAASEYDLDRARNDISVNVASFFLTVIQNKELLENAKSQLESGQQQLDQTQKLVASGALPIANQYQLESQVATNQVAVINNENNLELSLLTLKQALLLPPGEEIDVEVPEISNFQAGVEEINSLEVYEYALLNQPEIKAADARVKSTKLGLEVAKGAFYPSLSLNGNINTNYSDAIDTQFVPDGGASTFVSEPTDLQTQSGESVVFLNEIPSGTLEDYGVVDQWDDNLRYSVSLNVSVPIFNGLSTKSNVQRAKINVQQAEVNAKDERNTLYQTVESAYRSALAAGRTFEASEKQVAALQETFRAIENQYNNGAANFTDYQVAANNLFQAQSDLTRAKYEFIFRQKILDFYLGKPLTFE